MLVERGIMKIFKYLLLIAGIIMLESILVFALYYFAGMSKSLYIVFSLAVILGIAFYLIYGRYREKIKVSRKSEVRKKYLKRTLKIVLFLCILSAFAIIISGAWILIFRAYR
jgi:predicted PurR-regulated permease PerM